MSDRYTKAVLTVIAAALVWLAFQGLIPRAGAQMSGCGFEGNPCIITTGPNYILRMPNDPQRSGSRQHARARQLDDHTLVPA